MMFITKKNQQSQREVQYSQGRSKQEINRAT